MTRPHPSADALRAAAFGMTAEIPDESSSPAALTDRRPTRVSSLSPIASLDFRSTTGSTNDDAKAWIDRTDDEGSLAASLPRLHVAAEQTHGRGRNGRRWFADHHTLTFSLVLAADHTHPLGVLSVAVGVAIADAVQAHTDGKQVQLKWPNDVWLDERKLAGVLIERTRRSDSPWIIGIGINIGAVPMASFSPHADQPSAGEPRPTAASPPTMAAWLPSGSGSRSQWLERLIPSVLRHSDATRTDPSQIVREFDRQCILRGNSIRFERDRVVQRGTCLGVGPDGGLRVSVSGQQQTLYSGEVCRVRPDVSVTRPSNR